MEIRITPKQIAALLVLAIVCLTLVHLIVQSVRFASSDHSLYGLVGFVSLGSDGNVPTFYSAFAILLCSLILTLLGAGEIRDRQIPPAYWFGLAAIFVFLSVDEMLMLHEHLIEPVRQALNTSGVLFYAWVIPYGFGLLVFLAIYVRFLLLLPVRSRILFVVAGAMFVGGAVGVEMISGWYSEMHGNLNITYVAMQTVEELLEMVAIALFAYALLEYGDRRYGGLRLTVGTQRSTD